MAKKTKSKSTVKPTKSAPIKFNSKTFTATYSTPTPADKPKTVPYNYGRKK